MKIKWLAAAFALLMATALFAVDRNLTMHFIIDYSEKMQQELPGSKKTIAEACYDEFVGQMESLSKDENLKNLRFRYDTVLQYRPEYRAKKGEWLHSSSKDTKTMGAISGFERKEWLDTILKVATRPHLTPFNVMSSSFDDATETSDWDKYIENEEILKERLGGKNTLYVFFVYEQPKAELVDKLNRKLDERRSRCIFIPMRRGTQNTGTPENNVKRGFDEVRKLFQEEFGKNAKIVCDAEGDLYPGEYTFRIVNLGSDLPDGLEIKWSARNDSGVIKSFTQKNSAVPLMRVLLDDSGHYVIAAELKTSFRSLTLKRNIEIKPPKYEFSVEVRSRKYLAGDTIRIPSNSKVTARVKCIVTPQRERDNLKVVVKTGDSRSYDPDQNIALYPEESGTIILRDVKRNNRDLAVINFAVSKRVEEEEVPQTPVAPEPSQPEDKQEKNDEEEATKKSAKVRKLELVSVKQDGADVNFADGMYKIELGGDQETAEVVFKLNRSCKMTVTNVEKPGETDTWRENFPVGIHFIRFTAADGEPCRVTLSVTKDEKADAPAPVDGDDGNGNGGGNSKQEEDSLLWLWILLGVAAVAIVVAIVLKKLLGGRIFFLNYAIGQNDYQELERPFSPGRYRIDDSVFENCIGPFMINLSQENVDGDVLQKIVFEQLPHDWKLAVGNKPKSLNNGTSEEFIIGSDEYVLTSPKGMMKIKIRIKGN